MRTLVWGGVALSVLGGVVWLLVTPVRTGAVSARQDDPSTTGD